MRLILLSLLSVLLIASCVKKPAYPQAPVSGESVVIDINSLKEKAPVFYSLPYRGKRIDFFAVKVNGEVQSYFDACAKCYSEKLGYRVSGQYIVCKKCDVRYPVEDLKTGIGSCYPVALRGKTEGNRYMIDKRDVIAGNKFF